METREKEGWEHWEGNILQNGNWKSHVTAVCSMESGFPDFPCPGSPERWHIVPSLTGMATGAIPRVENLFSPRELIECGRKPGCILEGFRATGCTVNKPMSLSPWLNECHSHWAFRRVQLMCCPQGEDWEWRGARLLRDNPRSLERGEIFLDHVLEDLEVESS